MQKNSIGSRIVPFRRKRVFERFEMKDLKETSVALNWNMMVTDLSSRLKLEHMIPNLPQLPTTGGRKSLVSF